MIKLSATQCDSWIKYVNDVISEEQLIETLLRKGKPNLKMELGTMFHSLIEHQDAEIPQIFNLAQINHARSLFQNGMHEAKIRVPFESSIGTIALTGVADYLTGNKVMEAKTTWGAFSIDRYLESIQWQLYLMLFGAREIEYVVFEFPALSTKFNSLEDVNVELQYKEVHQFTLQKRMIDAEIGRAHV